MLNLEGIVARLKDRRLDAIQNATGLSKPTISNIRDGKQTNPEYGTMQKLSDYFESQESEATKD
jgi:transcriptional regulator with XRE-family HTH domain